MARAIKQFRYYSEGDFRNQPQLLNSGSNAESAATYLNLCNGNVFKNNHVYPILALGIQTLPGTKFYLNGSVDPIIVGSTGIYELDVIDKAEIINLRFDSTTLLTIRDSDGGYLLIDVLYDNDTGG